jgi:DNA-binding response OmpR family regulator
MSQHTCMRNRCDPGIPKVILISIKVHIRHLRKKLEVDPGKPKFIITKPGIGYLLTSPA